jgi:hypothetical protein
MIFQRLAAVVLLTAAAPATARDVPDNIEQFYKNITSQNKCSDILASGFYSKDGDKPSTILYSLLLPNMLTLQRPFTVVIISGITVSSTSEERERAW